MNDPSPAVTGPEARHDGVPGAVVADGPRAAPARGRPWSGHALGLAGLALAGVVLSAMPHAVNWWRNGDVNYIADGDQLLYMAWSRQAVLHGAGHLVDAVQPRSGPMMHPWLIFVPPALLAHALGTDTRGLAVIWRVLGGVGVALGLYAAVRPALRDRRVALGAAALLLFDAGFLFGQPLLRELDILGALLFRTGRFFDSVASVMAHLRVVPPALALPFLFVHYGLVLHARMSGSKAAAVAAGVAFGLLFHVYFYFWSAVLVGALLAMALDPKGWRLYATVLAIGLAVGLPAVMAGSTIKAATPPDWLHRTDKFVPIGRFTAPLIPKTSIALWLLAAFGVFRRRRELTYLWCCTTSALFCANHQVVTGLQIENFHWLIAMGSTLSLLVAALAVPWVFERGRPGLLVAMLAAQVALGLGLRWEEVTRTAETERWAGIYATLQADGITLPPGAVVAGDREGVMLVAALDDVYPLIGTVLDYSANTTDGEIDERVMLNLYLCGFDPASARREAERPPGILSRAAAASRSAGLALAQRRRRLALIEPIWTDPAPHAARLGVTHVLLPAAAAPETALRAVGPARPVTRGRHWQLWQVEPKPDPPARPARFDQLPLPGHESDGFSTPVWGLS